ncbi:MAG: FAD-dependent oxidoreductase [Opitutales bacterium]
MSASNTRGITQSRVDVLVVGQGIAGSWLAYQLMGRGWNVHIVDAAHQGSSSLVAAGIINPITGKRIAKSWQLDAVYKPAIAAYQALEQAFGQRYIHPCKLIRLYKNDEDKKRAEARFEDVDYTHWMHPLSKEAMPAVLKKREGFAIDGAAWVDMPALLESFKKHFQRQDALRTDTFNHTDLNFIEGSIAWQDTCYKWVIFCEGHAAVHNPLFSWLPFKPAKGEILSLQTPTAADLEGALINAGPWCLPINKDTVKVGATYSWDPLDCLPTELGKTKLLEDYNKLIPGAVTGTVVEHKAGIRPSTRDARPFIGFHPKHPALGIFNGFGSKGALLTPYYSTHFADVLMGCVSLDPEVNINRYDTPHAPC